MKLLLSQKNAVWSITSYVTRRSAPESNQQTNEVTMLQTCWRPSIYILPNRWTKTRQQTSLTSWKQAMWIIIHRLYQQRWFVSQRWFVCAVMVTGSSLEGLNPRISTHSWIYHSASWWSWVYHWKRGREASTCVHVCNSIPVHYWVVMLG